MRIGLLSDIHGNAVALDAVLAGLDRAGVDRLFCLGDVATLGPEPRRTLDTLRTLHCRFVMGNHDTYLLDPSLARTYTDERAVLEAIDWCNRRITDSDRSFVASFTATLEIELRAGIRLIACHGSPRSDTEDILATTPPDDLDRMLAGADADLVAAGHTHIQMLRQHRGAVVVNPGSVGLPFREYAGGRAPTLMPAHAEYAVVDAKDGALSVTLHRVAVDTERLRRSIEADDYPLAGYHLDQL